MLVGTGWPIEKHNIPVNYSPTDRLTNFECFKVGEMISRRSVNGDVVFLNRPPSTHKHSLQASYVYVKSYDKLLGKFQYISVVVVFL